MRTVLSILLLGTLAVAQEREQGKTPPRREHRRAVMQYSGPGIIVETEDGWIVAPGSTVPASSYAIAKTTPFIPTDEELVEAQGWMDLEYDDLARSWSVRVTDADGETLFALAMERDEAGDETERARFQVIAELFAYMAAGEQPPAPPPVVAHIVCPSDKRCCSAREGVRECSVACDGNEVPTCTSNGNGVRCTCTKMAA